MSVTLLNCISSWFLWKALRKINRSWYSNNYCVIHRGDKIERISEKYLKMMNIFPYLSHSWDFRSGKQKLIQVQRLVLFSIDFIDTLSTFLFVEI